MQYMRSSPHFSSLASNSCEVQKIYGGASQVDMCDTRVTKENSNVEQVEVTVRRREKKNGVKTSCIAQVR